ncbi:TetR/AcrR family transcriptional regulator [Rhodococcus sp. NPDC056743]|uniref:TetR/AcrR family transcriptional regulator n=1 Tax=Rhodococcus sp. NPDC056743 TaxID=3345934 RepID=UPI00366D6F88
MAEVVGDGASRLERRKARTRTALVRAAQSFIAEGKLNVPVLEITQAADVGMGSFYNHFESKEQLFQAAVDDAFEAHGNLLDRLTGDIDDPAEVFAHAFRLTGRLHRIEPELCRVLLAHGSALITSDQGLAPRALRDIESATAAGRFTVADPQVALALAAGAAVGLGQLLHDQPERDDAEATDRMTEDILRAFGLPAEEAHRICQLPLPDLSSVASLGSVA